MGLAEMLKGIPLKASMVYHTQGKYGMPLSVKRSLTHQLSEGPGYLWGVRHYKWPWLCPQKAHVWESESESHSVSNSLQPHGLRQSMEFSRPEYRSG